MSDRIILKETKYLRFEQVPIKRKTKYVEVISLNDSISLPLGYIEWYGAWRQYVFYPERDTLWNNCCLTDVISVINLLMLQRRSASQEKANKGL